MKGNKTAVPPDRTKYGFGYLDLNEIKFLNGNYRLVRIAANTYGKVHNKRFLVVKSNEIIRIERYK